MEILEVEHHALEFVFVPKEPMTREDVAIRFKNAMIAMAKEGKHRMEWRNYYKKMGVQCENGDYFHVTYTQENDTMHVLDGKKMCNDCIRNIIGREADDI